MEKMKKILKTNKLARSLKLNREEVNVDERTVEIAYSSETPYQRWFGMETLSHDVKHIDQEFIKSGTAPLLVGHDHSDQIGVIESAVIGEDKVGRAVVRFGKSPRAEEIYQDVLDGIRSNISVGYYVDEMTLTKSGGDKNLDEFLVTKWRPVEASIVPVPADPSVGVGRSDDIETETKIINPTITVTEKKEPIMEPVVETVDIKAIENSARDKELNRIRNIQAIAEKSGMDGNEAISSGLSAEDFRAKAFDAMVDKAKDTAIDLADLSVQDKKDTASFSFTKAIQEFGAGRLSGVEKEMHEEGMAQNSKFGRTTEGLSIPYQVLAQKDMTVGTSNQGGYTVATNLLAGSFIELLQNRMKVKDMGATVLDGLVGDIAIPSQATGATAAWEGENDANAESSPTFGQLALSPNRVGTYTEISKKLLVQSSLSVDNIIKNLIADSIAQAIDLAALHGTGANDQPTGIAATSGIGSVAGGTNGLIPTLGNIVELETDVAVANADLGAMGYLSNAKVRGKLKQVFTNATYGDIPLWYGGKMNDYRAEVSNQVSSALTKGSASGICSAIFFGNWSDLVLAFWGGLDIVVDPYSLATTNLTRITCNSYADVGVRHAASFSAMLDALT